MIYNKQRLDNLIDKLDFRPEADRLFQAGLTYPKLAGIIYNTLNPAHIKKRFKWRYFFNTPGPNKGKRNFDLLMLRYGIGTTERLSDGKLAKKFDISSSAVDQINKRLEMKILFEDDYLRNPYTRISNRQKEYINYKSCLKKEIFSLGLDEICKK